MNVRRDPDAILASWLEEGPSRLPDAARRAIAVTTRTTRQTRRPMRVPWRTPSMNPLGRMAAVVITVVVVIGGAFYALAPGIGPGGQPTAIPSATPTAIPSPTASPTRSATPAPSAQPLAAGGDVFPGTYRTAFDPAMTLTIDKEVAHNCAPGFQCRGTIDVNLPGWLNIEFGQPRIEILVIRVDKVVDLQNPSKLVDPPADLVAWMANVPGITVVNPPKAIKVGGLDATQIDVQSGNKDLTFGPIPGVNDPGFGMGANTTQRYIVVHVGGRQVVISPAGQDPFLQSVAEMQPLVDSIVWD